MWSKKPTTPAPYPVAGRILNRHKRGRPRFKIWQRLKKVVIPLAVFGLIGLAAWLADWLGVI